MFVTSDSAGKAVTDVRLGRDLYEEVSRSVWSRVRQDVRYHWRHVDTGCTLSTFVLTGELRELQSLARTNGSTMI